MFRTWKVTLFHTALAWKESKPEWEFGSWQAEQFRQGTPILSFAERRQLSSNSTYRTWKVTLFPNVLALEEISTRMRVWKLTSKAFPSSNANIKFRWTPPTFFKFNVSNLQGETFSKPLLPWKESQPEWEFGSWRAKQFRQCTQKFATSFAERH